MDSKVLSKEQLQQLVKFIHSRGFKEPAVMLEILDHFACKVEEILAVTPDIPFDVAMQKAHQSFGTMGFRPIEASFEQQTGKKYKTIFRKKFQTVISSPLSVILLPLIGLGFFKFFMLSVEHQWNHILGQNDAVLLFFVVLLATQFILIFSFSKENRKYAFARYAINSGNFTGLSGLLFYILIGFNNVPDTDWAWIPGLVFTGYFVYSVPRFIAASQAIRKAEEDIRLIKQMMIEP